MNIVAIDPGPVESAWVMVYSGKVTSFGKGPNQEVLSAIRKLDTIDRCVIEMIASYGMPVGAEVFETCVWIGRFMQAFGAERCDRLTRVAIKSHLCHSAKAKDGNIRQAIIDRLGSVGTKKFKGPCYGISGDVWQALACGITWMDLNGGAKWQDMTVRVRK